MLFTISSSPTKLTKEFIFEKKFIWMLLRFLNFWLILMPFESCYFYYLLFGLLLLLPFFRFHVRFSACFCVFFCSYEIIFRLSFQPNQIGKWNSKMFWCRICLSVCYSVFVYLTAVAFVCLFSPVRMDSVSNESINKRRKQTKTELFCYIYM